MPRPEPPVWTSTRTPGWRDSKRLPISPASGATVLAPVRTSFPASGGLQLEIARRTARLRDLMFNPSILYEHAFN
jgi:hypothetical protein